MDTLAGVAVSVSALLGRCSLPIRDVLELMPGTVLPLHARASAPVPLLVNGIAIASGDIVATEDGELAIEIREVFGSEEIS